MATSSDARDGLDTNNVLDWNARPRRAVKRRAPSYWEEFIETDDWYLKKLVEDVPAEEMHAALYDEDLEDDVDQSGDDSKEEEDDYMDEEDDSFVDVDTVEESEDDDYEPMDASDNGGDGDEEDEQSEEQEDEEEDLTSDEDM